VAKETSGGVSGSRRTRIVTHDGPGLHWVLAARRQQLCTPKVKREIFFPSLFTHKKFPQPSTPCKVNMSAQGQPGDPFTYVPRDVRNMIWDWLGPSPLWRVRARSVCRAWMEWVPCVMDVVRSLETGELTVLPKRWSLVETVIRLVLYEPDEVCSRMDGTMKRFLALNERKTEDSDNGDPKWKLVPVMVHLGKISAIDSFMRHAHLVESEFINSQTYAKELPREIMFHATLENRIDILLHYRYAFWTLPVMFRQRLLWIALFHSNRQTFDALFNELGCGDIKINNSGDGRFFSIKQMDYLKLSPKAKRNFVDKVIGLPEDCQLLHRLQSLWKHTFVSRDVNILASYIDVEYARKGHVSHLSQYDHEECDKKRLVHGLLSPQCPFVQRRAPYDDEEDETSSLSESSEESYDSSDKHDNQVLRVGYNDRFAVVNPSREWGVLELSLRERDVLDLLRSARLRTQTNAANRKRDVDQKHGRAIGAAAQLEEERARLYKEKLIDLANERWAVEDRPLPSRREELKLKRTKKRSVYLELRHFWASRPGKKRTREDLFHVLATSRADEDDDFIVHDDDHDPESHHSSEEARILDEEDGLEFMDDEGEEESSEP